jgi:TsgA-like MFS transporter
MSFDKVRLFVVCMLTAFVIAGFLAPYGLLVGPIANAFDIEVGAAGSLFSFFTSGIFFGYIAAFYVFTRIGIKAIIVGGYAVVILAVIAVFLVPAIVTLSLALALIGFFCSLAVCGSVTLISQTWDGKKRQSALVAQDAAFNGGGMLFTAITGYLLGQGLSWQAGYAPAATIALISIAIALFSRLAIDQPAEDQTGEKTEWNAGIILVGVLVMLFMAAKLTVIVWAPQYLEQEFGASPRQAGAVMSNIFRAAFLGSLVGTYVVSKVKIHHFLTAMIFTGVIATFVMLASDDLQIATAMGYLFGLSVSATFNSYMAFALGFVDSPNHRHVAYMLLVGAVGSGLGPLISGQSVIVTETTRTPIVMAFGLMALVLIGVMVFGTQRMSKRLKSLGWSSN